MRDGHGPTGREAEIQERERERMRGGGGALVTARELAEAWSKSRWPSESK